MTPLLSIVIANYNYGRFLEEAIRSVLDQAVPEVELLVIDGGSTDESVDIIRRYAHPPTPQLSHSPTPSLPHASTPQLISYWVSEKDKGQSDAFNKGFSHAKGKYLTWLNADDVMPSGCLARVVGEMKAHPDCEWFTANTYRFTQDGKIVGLWWGPRHVPTLLQGKGTPIAVYGPSTFFAKALYERVGRIDESLHLIMDIDLWERFVLAGAKFRRLNWFCWGFRMHEASKTAEFGDHRLDDSATKKLAAENVYKRQKNAYRESRVKKLLIQALRLLDGSFLRRYLLLKSYRRM